MTMRRPPRPDRSRPPGSPPPRDPLPDNTPPYALLIAAGLAIYLAGLWLGVTVIQDTPLRSAVMAAFILSIAAAGYVFTRPQRPGGR